MSLSDLEHEAIALTGELAGLLRRIVGEDTETSQQDLEELIIPLHHIQRSIMAQSAAREHPDLYRLLGGAPIRAKKFDDEEDDYRESNQ